MRFATSFGKIYISQKKKSCSALVGLMKCGFWSESSAVFCLMQYIRRFWVAEKQSVRFSVNSKFLLNRKELERVFYMKEVRIIDIFPTAYDLNYSDQPFVKISQKNSCCLSKSAARFSKLTKNCKESQNHFNI